MQISVTKSQRSLCVCRGLKINILRVFIFSPCIWSVKWLLPWYCHMSTMGELWARTAYEKWMRSSREVAWNVDGPAGSLSLCFFYILQQGWTKRQRWILWNKIMVVYQVLEKMETHLMSERREENQKQCGLANQKARTQEPKFEKKVGTDLRPYKYRSRGT